MIETIVNTINASFNHYNGLDVQVFGLADPVIKREINEEKEEEILMPAIIECGELKYPFVDDDYKFGFYHKLNSKKYEVSQKEGYGSTAKQVVNASLSLIVWGFNIKAEELEQFFAYYKPGIMVFTDTIFDRNSVFSSEFKGVNFFLPPEVCLFKINYTVRYTQKNECLEINEIFTNNN